MRESLPRDVIDENRAEYNMPLAINNIAEREGKETAVSGDGNGWRLLSRLLIRRINCAH